MIARIKHYFTRNKDNAGRNINSVINNLARQSGSCVYAWSYLKDESVYENTVTGQRVYHYELSKHAA